MFTEGMLVTDVHWWGGFWNGPPDEVEPCPFYIYFYADDGTGNAPTGAGMPDPAPTALASYYFPGVSGLPLDPNGYYEYNVDLSPGFSAAAGVKYWIAIQADFPYPPQWGWTDTDGIQLHSATSGFPFLGTAFWTDLDPAVDVAYYLTGIPDEPWPDHKMHFPQLPDLIGWDVMATVPVTLGDDWQCSRSGPVTDIHFWGSWKDQDGIPETDDIGQILFFQFGIWSNLPVGHPQNPFPYSIPGTLLWGMEEWVPGMPTDPPTLEGWIDPWTGGVIYNDHVPYWRYDFVDIPDPFVQMQDSVYWLTISAVLDDPQNFQWGWKNSTDHFMDDAVFMDPTGQWVEMYEPPRYNEFTVEFGPDGVPMSWSGTNYYGEGFYGYEYWWNMWFYDNPFTYEHPKNGVIEFWVDPIGPDPWLEFAINWSSDLWSLEGVPGRPPLPGVEEIYVEREIIGPLEPIGQYTFPIDIPYNPEWISVDFNARDVVIGGFTYHECVGTSLDMAFVITGPECTPSMDVEKKVWDEDLGDWVDSVDVDVCNNVDFLISILNDGTCDLTDITVEDFMDSSLEYVDADLPPDIINPVPGGTYLEWNFPGLFTPGSTIDITVTAHVVGPVCHLDSNYVFVHGSYEPGAIEVYDQDVAYVHATEEPWPNHKMHYPQLPDPQGWDIVATQGFDMHPGIVCADDFMCTESGPITDVHFWGSWLYNQEMPIMGFWLSIHDNIPGPPYSMPGTELWSAYVTDFEWTPMDPSPQGWYDPFAPYWEHPNHDIWYRYDIDSIPEPFVQDSGTIYWLNVMADLGPPGYLGFPEPYLWGWKTSRSPHFEDDAVWSIWGTYDWIPLTDPNTGLTLDLSFVITTSEVPVICGDVNNDGIVNIGDVVYMVSYLYKAGPAPIPMPCVGDVNNDDIVNVGDIVYLVSYLYKSGPVPNPNCCNPPWKK